MESKFIWTDLSTFDLSKATDFYHKVFGWSFSEDRSGYFNCSLGRDPCAGLYEMPAFFQKIRMPSFWMTYISVNNIESITAKARELGGKVELEEDNPRGRIALIRDPAGAGVTCYEGDEILSKPNLERPGSWCWTELMVSSISLVRKFYETLFDWRFEAHSGNRYNIKTATGVLIGAAQVAGKEEKGSKEFWAAYFAVSDLGETIHTIKEAGGCVEGIYTHEDGAQALAYDDQGAAFFLIQKDGPSAADSSSFDSLDQSSGKLK
ncbi:MAG: VOC family protein [Verrucomicrobiota bacterium]